jgi:hypothetical protein
MGQYYYPIILDSEGKIVAWMCAHEYSNGLKLMEHSFIGNNFVSAFEWGLTPKGSFHKSRVVWAGDYADVEESGETLYTLCEEDTHIAPPSYTVDYPYIVNHTKKQFVDKDKVSANRAGYKIHPLPLLTCEGNGRGGGDYRPEDHPLIGIWARDVISVEKEKPDGYVEIAFDLIEHF